MTISPDQTVWFEFGFIRISSTLLFTWLVMVLLVLLARWITRRLAADATLSPIESRKSFNLTEVTKNVYVMPGGFYRGTCALIMNQEKFDSLPADIQEALDGVFGEAASRMAGKVWDEIDEDGWEATRSAGDNVIVEASQADQESFAAIAANVRKQVLENVSATGVDANAAFEAIQSEIGAAR